MKAIEINNTTQIGSWEDVKGIEASTITKNVADTEKLDGLIIKGYEVKFDKVNENGEKYSKDAFDKFLENYFVANKMNVPVDVMHGIGVDDLIGRVIYAEVSATGLYFVAYVPRKIRNFEHIKTLLEEQILQGFSKFGYATDYEYKYDKNGNFEYMLIKEFDLLSVSLVATPANRLTFDKVAEVKNATRFNHVGPKKKKFFK